MLPGPGDGSLGFPIWPAISGAAWSERDTAAINGKDDVLVIKNIIGIYNWTYLKKLISQT